MLQLSAILVLFWSVNIVIVPVSSHKEGGVKGVKRRTGLGRVDDNNRNNKIVDVVVMGGGGGRGKKESRRMKEDGGGKEGEDGGGKEGGGKEEGGKGGDSIGSIIGEVVGSVIDWSLEVACVLPIPFVCDFDGGGGGKGGGKDDGGGFLGLGAISRYNVDCVTFEEAKEDAVLFDLWDEDCTTEDLMAGCIGDTETSDVCCRLRDGGLTSSPSSLSSPSSSPASTILYAEVEPIAVASREEDEEDQVVPSNSQVVDIINNNVAFCDRYNDYTSLPCMRQTCPPSKISTEGKDADSTSSLESNLIIHSGGDSTSSEEDRTDTTPQEENIFTPQDVSSSKISSVLVWDP